MVEIKVKDTVYGTAILILITIMGVQLQSTDNWYYCELENTLKECNSLSSYGIPDAKCIGVDGKNDICTASGTRQAWQPIENYINLTIDKEVVVESLQECHIENYTIFESNPYSCMETLYNYSNCADILPNGTCTEYSSYLENSTCYNDILVVKNRTVCEPLGYNVLFKNGDEYNITGACCGYFNETQEIVCKEKVNGICNPSCQQTSIDPEIYDEYCTIYKIGDKSVIPNVVGEYDYVRDYQVKLSDMKVKLK